MARGRSGRGDRQRLAWTGMPAGSLSLTGDGTSISPGAVNFGSSTGTIRRVRGVITVGLEATIAADDEVLIAIGLGLFSTDAVSLGATAIPDAGGDVEYPWMWYDSRHMRAPGALTNATWVDGASGAAFYRLEVDVKAMRKFRTLESLAFSVQYVNVAGNPGVFVGFGHMRILQGFG